MSLIIKYEFFVIMFSWFWQRQRPWSPLRVRSSDRATQWCFSRMVGIRGSGWERWCCGSL